MKFVLLSLFFLLITFNLTNPFSQEIASITFPTNNLNQSQLQNVKIASEKINNYVLKPNEVFSFNKTIGPRTSLRGFQEAAVYLDSETTSSLGGGLCLLSSLLYQIALKSNLKIIERHPHLKPISSTKPGLDATVWYGSLDLKFKNTYDFPVKVQVILKQNKLTVSLYGKYKIKPATITRKALVLNSKKIKVQVFRNSELVSTDYYDSF